MSLWSLTRQPRVGQTSQDGDLLREIVLGVLRNRARIDAELSPVSRVPLPRLAPNLREILEGDAFQKASSRLTLCLGKTVHGEPARVLK